MKKLVSIIFILFIISLNISAQWHWQYPVPQGNRLNDMVMVDGTITGYAVGNNGTIIKTEDRGLNWELQDSVTTVDLNGIAFATETKGYAVGENGVCLTTDDGENWSVLETGTHYHLKGVDFSSAENGCIVGYKGLILIKIGDHWEESDSPTTYTLYDVYFPTEVNGIAVGDSGTILRTSDGGSNWVKIQNPYNTAFNDVYFSSDFVGYITGQKGVTLKTTDAGLTWTDISYPQIEDNLLSIHFYDDSNGYVSGANGALLSTRNAGANWIYESKATTLSFNEIILLDPFVIQDTLTFCDTLLICGDYGSIFRSDSCSARMNNVTGGSTYTISTLKFVNDTMAWGVGGDVFNHEPLIIRTGDNGKNWESIIFDTINRYLTDFDFIDVDLAYISGQGGVVYKYQGDSMLPIQTGFYEHLYALRAFDTSTVYVAGLNGALLKTVLGDTTWHDLYEASSEHLYGMYFFNKEKGYVVGDQGTLLRVTNGGDNVKKITTGTSVPLYDIFFVSDVLGFMVGYDGKIFKITIEDGTESLVQIPSGLLSPLNAVYFPSPDIGYISGEGGVMLKSTDGGESWYPQYTGTFNGLRTLFFKDNDVGFTAGAGLSILKTENGGGAVILPGISERNTIEYEINLYPNPTTNQTWIEFELREKSPVKISAYDLAGRQLAVIADGIQSSGRLKYNYNTSGLTKGIYLMIVEINGRKHAKKLIILR